MFDSANVSFSLFASETVWIGKKSAEIRMKNITRTDLRIKIMDEILYGIQVIKMYAWEKSFAKIVGYIRK